MYVPGLHILSTIQTATVRNLRNAAIFRESIEQWIEKLALTSVGAVYHDFPADGGFTAVVCLTESHVSVHTWPEYQTLTMDIFLSNNTRNNEDKCRQLQAALLEAFDIQDLHVTELYR